MKKDLLNENRPRILLALTALVVLSVLLLVSWLMWRSASERNDRQVADAVSALTYSEDTAPEELTGLEALTTLSPLSDQAGASLYRALAEIAYMTGDDMGYNRYVAQALFYLTETKDVTGTAYLANKYIGRLYANGCYASAEEVLGWLADMTPISELALETQAAYYLSCADVAQMQHKDDAALMDSARAAILLLPEGGNRELQQAKLSLLTARGLTEAGDFDGAAAIISRYSDTDDFGLGAHQVYVVCDFLLPYLELSARLNLQKQDTEAASRLIDRYMAICDSYQFRAMKLRLLQYAVAHTAESGTTAADAVRYQALEQEVSQTNLAEMTEEYGQFLLSDIRSAMREAALAREQRHQQLLRVPLAAGLIYLMVLAYCLGAIFLDYMSKDGLTRLNGRRQYERARIICEKKRIPYALLMLDIDNFKHINDAYGHDTGDQVLRSIATELRAYSGRGISSYRYGGEEMCMMLLRVPEPRVREIAEELRGRIAQRIGTPERPVTISGGIAISTAGENVFREADQRLYEAKASGKNQIK